MTRAKADTAATTPGTRPGTQKKKPQKWEAGRLGKKGDHYYIRFRFGGKQLKRGLGTANAEDAKTAALLVGKMLHRIRTGQITIPEGVDAGDFIVSGGQAKSKEEERAAQVTLREALDAFLKSPYHLQKAPSTQVTDRVHVRHLAASPMADKRLRSLRDRDLQDYVNFRQRRHDDQGNPLRPAIGKTVFAELSFLRSVWNGLARVNAWVDRDYKTAFPRRLALGTMSEKPGFTHFAEGKRIGDLRSVYLLPADVQRLRELLFKRRRLAKFNTRFDWVPFATSFCLYTSARRSSMRAALLRDVNLDNGTLVVRSKKEGTGSYSTKERVLPILTQLSLDLEAWLSRHPGGGTDTPLFCSEPDKQLTPEEAHDGLEAYLKGTEFEGIGWHCFRHSFITNAAATLPIDTVRDWSGHRSADVARIYRHVRPQALAQGLDQQIYRT